MKLLLIQPPTINTIFCECPERFQDELGFYPPLGLMYIASYLRKFSHHSVVILDALVEKLGYQDIAQHVKSHNPDIVGISTTTLNLVDVCKTAQEVKRIKPDTLIVLGGPHTSIYPEETLRLPNVDIVVIGEGEITMKELLDALERRDSLENIAGIGYKKDGRICLNKNRPVIENLDILPFPSWDITPYKKYYSVFAQSGMSTNIMTSRGCPYSCIFCFHETVRRLRVRSAKNVVDEIEEALKMDIKEFFIFDETFTINQQRVHDICGEILKRKLQISFDMRTRVDIISEELLKSLKKAGCKRIQYGVESGSQRILNLMKKGITLEQARRAFSLTKKMGMATYADFMLGFPGETKEEMFQTISFAVELNPDFVQFAITTLYPATEIYQMALQQGILKSDFWREFSQNPCKKVEPPLWTEPYSHDELLNILETAYSRFYVRPRYILKRLSKIRTVNEFLRHLRMGKKVIFR